MDHLYSGVDIETIALIVQLQREDIEALTSQHREGEDDSNKASDTDLALQVQLRELDRLETYHTDRRMARSHAFAVLADGNAVCEEVMSEEQASRDREIALRLRRAPDSEMVLAIEATPDNSGDEVMARQEARVQAAVLQGNAHVAHSTEKGLQVAVVGQPAKDEQFAVCCVCREEKAWFDMFKAPCGHDYCIECVTQLFELSMTDETLYPPRCCRETIPIDDAEKILNPKLVQLFKDKSVELESKDRTYCFVPTCSRFIPPAYIHDAVGTCAGCGRRTCAICKTAAHMGDCPEDTALQNLLEIADNAGWQRCSSCRRVVDLRSGCNHITSVTCAARIGCPEVAPVLSGTKIDSKNAQLKSPTAPGTSATVCTSLLKAHWTLSPLFLKHLRSQVPAWPVHPLLDEFRLRPTILGPSAHFFMGLWAVKANTEERFVTSCAILQKTTSVNTRDGSGSEDLIGVKSVTG